MIDRSVSTRRIKLFRAKLERGGRGGGGWTVCYRGDHTYPLKLMQTSEGNQQLSRRVVYHILAAVAAAAAAAAAAVLVTKKCVD